MKCEQFIHGVYIEIIFKIMSVFSAYLEGIYKKSIEGSTLLYQGT